MSNGNKSLSNSDSNWRLTESEFLDFLTLRRKRFNLTPAWALGLNLADGLVFSEMYVGSAPKAAAGVVHACGIVH
jgi:hypothetical protein